MRRGKHQNDPVDPTDERGPMALDEDAVEAIARRVCELLAETQVGASGPRLVSAAEVAGRLGRKRAWVYANAERLGALRLGDGPRPRLMFDLTEIEGRLRNRSPESAPTRPAPAPGRMRRKMVMPEAPLLPVGPARTGRHGT